MAVGRITGPLLKANLLRDGVDLAFETDLLYLNVTDGKVGINTTPTSLDSYELGINGTTRTTDLEVTNQADIAEFTILGNTISSTNSTINLEPAGANAVVYQGKIVTGDLQISTNTIEVTASATDLEINTLGTGKVNVNSDMQINGDLHVTGTITADGDIGGQITLGDTNTDNIVFNAEINSHVIPDAHDTYDLGSDPTLLPTPGKAWRALYADTVVSTTLELQDLTVNNDLTVSGNSTFNGDVTFGDATTDTVTVNGTISGNIIPTTTDFYDIGSDTARWADGFFSRIEIDKLVIDNNTISTTNGNDDLVLTANGTGIISIPSNDVQIDQALTVTGQTTLNGTEIAGNITHTGDVTQTGNFTQTGNTTITGNLTVSTFGQFEKIRIDSNVLSTTATDTDLQLEANGAGKIYVPTDNVLIDQNLTVNTLATFNTLEVTTQVTAASFDTSDILIQTNTITTQLTDSDLELSANGLGIISIPTNNVQLDQQLTVNGSTTLQDTTIGTLLAPATLTQTGDVTQTGDYTQTGNTEITGNLTVSSYAQFEKIRIDLNTISTTVTNADLTLEANGTGRVYIPTNDVLIDQNLTVDGLATIADVDVTNTLTAGSFSTGDILIDDNYITTQLADSNLELKSNGTGIISIPTNDVLIDQNLTVTQDLTVTTGTTNLKAVGIVGDITQTGNIDLTGDFTTSGTVEVTGNITATGTLEVGDISIAGHTIQVTTSGTDLDLRTTGVANIIFEDFKVNSNIIESTGVNQDIILQPQGTGSVIINSNQSLIIPVGSTADRPASGTEELGMIRYNTTLSRYEAWNGTYWIRLGGVYDVAGNTRILAESAPGANENVLYFYAGGNLTATIDATKLFAERFQTTGVDINGNTISALVTDTDLNLTTSGTGGVKVGNLRLRNNTIINTVSGAVTEIGKTGNGYVKITGTNGVVIPVGDTGSYPVVAETGMMRFNTFYGYVEVYTGTTWVNSAGATSGVTLAQAQDIGIVSALLFG